MPLDYGDETIDDAIVALIQLAGGTPDSDLVKEVVITALKAIEDRMSRGDLKLVNSALKEMRYAFKVFSQYRRVRKAAMFGSARIGEEAPEYRAAFEFARQMTMHGWMVITGAGGGIMQAGHAGAGRERSFGVNIRLPFEQSANAIIRDDPKLINFKYFFTRKLIFVKEADAVVLFPGGFGTMDEGFECLTLVQTGKSNPVPIVLLDAPGGDYWRAWDEYVRRQLRDRGLISRDDLALYRIVADPVAACEEVLRFYRRYHSSRFVREKLVIRMIHPLDAESLDLLNREFGDLVASGAIEQATALPEEAEEQHLLPLPRLTFQFVRRNYGRLRMLIDRLNELPIPPSA